MKECICREISTSTSCNENGVWKIEKELIRCKDCIYFHPDSTGCWCGRHSSAYGFALDVCENDFCAWAERKEE